MKSINFCIFVNAVCQCFTSVLPTLLVMDLTVGHEVILMRERKRVKTLLESLYFCELQILENF
jgi:hypothetical protein